MTMVLDPAPHAEVPFREPLSFPSGLPGLEGYKRFTLVGVDDLPVYWLECDDEPAITLPLADAAAVISDYSIELSDWDTAELGLTRPEDAMILVVLTLSAATGRATANLLAPIVVSRVTATGKQVILDGSGYSLRHPIPVD